MVILCECLVHKMAEFPSQSCGPCPHLAQFAAVEDKKSPTYEFLAQNTIPEPNIQFQDSNANPNEMQLGIPSTYQNPDLHTSPFQKVECSAPKEPVIPLAEKPSKKLDFCLGSCLGSGPKGGEKDCKSCCPTKTTSVRCLPPTENNNGKVTSSNVEKIDPNKNNYTNNTITQQEAPLKSILKTTPEAGSQQLNCACPPAQSGKQISFSADIPQNQASPEMYATAGRTAPGAEDPTITAAVPSDLRPVPPGKPPCYMPQPEDVLMKSEIAEMGAIGPWATGKADWGPLGGMTGTRPVVDKYSITRFSEGEWRIHNKDVLDQSAMETHKSTLVDWNSRQCLEQTQADVDKNQEDNTKRLNQRQMEILRWKCELERAIAAASEEISFTEEQRARLKTAAAVLQMPESIAGECLERRTGRLDSELVRDEVEEELIKELSLCAEIRDIFARTLKDIEKQLLEDKTAKQRLEYDWSDKKDALEIDATNVALNTRSTVLLFKPGAVIFPESQSTPEYWQHFTKETLLESEATRQRSAALRGTLDAILTNASRDLRTQADKVEMALARRIACTEELTRKLESELKGILKKLAEVEDLLIDLRAAIRRMDTPMKKAQTRLDNRLLRPRVENCRDVPHFGLINEVKSISDNVAALQAQYNQADKLQTDLTNVRSKLEREIMLKMKTLEIDRERTRRIRSYYPSANALAGH